MANEAKQFTIGGVTHDVMDVGARQLIADLQAAIDAITSGDTTTAIKTFQEVINFLEGVTDDATLIGKLNELRTLINAKYSKPASGIPASDLADGVVPDVGGFATKTEVVKSITVNGQTQQKDTNGNVNVVVPTAVLDDAPTDGSNNGVKSGGVKTALDNLLQNLTIGQNGNWYVGQTDTGVTAQGPAGNCTITDAGQMVSEIVNDLDTGGTSKFLSAEMGKKLKNAIVTIYNALGKYAFPSGKPTIDLNASVAVSITAGTHITHTDISNVAMGAALEVAIDTDNDLYIVDESSIVVTMNGVTVADAYDAATGKIVIGSVTGTVVITIGNAVSYIDADGTDSQLVFHLDCKRRGGQSGHWIDLIGQVDFALTDVTEADTGMVFNGITSKGVASGGLNVSYNDATVEVVIDASSIPATSNGRWPILANTQAGSATAAIRRPGNYFIAVAATDATGVTGVTSYDTNTGYSFYFGTANKAFGTTKETVVLDGLAPASPRRNGDQKVHDYACGVSSIFGVGYGNINSTGFYFVGKILAIRVYNTKLTEAQLIHNYNIDKQYYNL